MFYPTQFTLTVIEIIVCTLVETSEITLGTTVYLTQIPSFIYSNPPGYPNLMMLYLVILYKK
ncbi:hypothetical protein E0M25_10360 [Bacillus mycoides]|uniref:Uncharacterized protein n=1 Tax=Bacillus cereus TaxID=1396 RepID=A0A1S9UD38_BACCE|nr:hypothetical protein BW892_24605 [Bacillus cereus]TBX78478.1 hypothetical protein E0M25_10360 [Bacillus mycoides]